MIMKPILLKHDGCEVKVFSDEPNKNPYLFVELSLPGKPLIDGGPSLALGRSYDGTSWGILIFKDDGDPVKGFEIIDESPDRAAVLVEVAV